MPVFEVGLDVFCGWAIIIRAFYRITRAMNQPIADLDSPWKEILRSYFPQAIQFFFPETAALIDWTKPYEFLDKEFQKVARDAVTGRRYADLLVKVWLLSGESTWLLLHVEVQAEPEAGFEERVFIYNIRIFDLYRQIPVSLAILCDDSPTWKPQRYAVHYPDTQMTFQFGTVKLLDWRGRLEELEASTNPFATVVMTHLKFQDTRNHPQQRKEWKWRLTRALYEKGYSRQEIQDLYRFIDWVIMLPEEIEREFWQELKAFEEERKVTYVTNAERFGFEQGLDHERSLIIRQLNRKVGNLPESTVDQIQNLPLSDLDALGDVLLDFTQFSDLETWLRSH
jgi:hypothetical protein